MMSLRLTLRVDMKSPQCAAKRHLFPFKEHDSYCFHSSFTGGGHGY